MAKPISSIRGAAYAADAFGRTSYSAQESEQFVLVRRSADIGWRSQNVKIHPESPDTAEGCYSHFSFSRKLVAACWESVWRHDSIRPRRFSYAAWYQPILE